MNTYGPPIATVLIIFGVPLAFWVGFRHGVRFATVPSLELEPEAFVAEASADRQTLLDVGYSIDEADELGYADPLAATAAPETFVVRCYADLECGHRRPLGHPPMVGGQIRCLACGPYVPIAGVERVRPVVFPHPDRALEDALGWPSA